MYYQALFDILETRLSVFEHLQIGRRDPIFIACFFWLVGTSVQVTAENSGTLIAGRVIHGITVGITSSQVPVYLAEIAKAETRGSIVIIQQLAIEPSFRTAWGIQFNPAVLLVIGVPFLPHSPRWLAKVVRNKETIETLARTQAGGNVDDPLVIAEWNKISTTIIAEREAGQGWRNFVKNGMWKRTLVGMSVQAWQRWALVLCHFVIGGVMAAHHYGVPEGVDGNPNVVFAVTSGAPAYTVIVFSYLLIIVYALTLAPVCWIYAGEGLVAGDTRAAGMSMAALANWLFNFALGMFTPPGFVNIKYNLFITLEEIELLFSKDGPKPWETRKGESRLEVEIQGVLEKHHGHEEPIADAVEAKV
ncbi:hypothetical protein KJ359_002476 [Pestalotiopsis sp. 9143b]|nr:hypothetical protein KJ359_002476 [Pestalotiopsis sp. 9143b]